MKIKVRRKATDYSKPWCCYCHSESIEYDHVFEIDWCGSTDSFYDGHFWLKNYGAAFGRCFDIVYEAVKPQNPTVKSDVSGVTLAPEFLKKALGHMEDRAATYDKEGGERSMGKTVAAFNAITGSNLTEEEGWLFMEILKQVRSMQGGFKADNYEDLAAYAALRGECASRDRGGKP
jgi:hypothetical protein